MPNAVQSALRATALTAAILAAVAPAARADWDADEPAGSRGEPDRDDPRARADARLLQAEGVVRSAEASLHILQTARAEAQRYGLDRRGVDAAARVAGSAWVNLGPSSAAFEINGAQYTKVDSGRAQRILVDPRDPNVVYFATAGGGVWKSFDALAQVTATTGPHWQPITETVGSLSVGSLAMDPRSPDTLLLALGDEFDVHTPGLLRSDDGGATWSAPIALTGTVAGAQVTATAVRDIAWGGAQSNAVLIATNVGVFRSADRGTSGAWTLLDLAPAHDLQGGWSIAVSGTTWIVSTQDANRGGHLYRSTDDGASWATVATADTDVARMTVALADASRAYLLAEGLASGTTKDLYRSDDGGATFKSLGVNANGKPTNPNVDQADLDVMHGQAWYNQMLAVDPANHDNVLVGGNLALVRSRDGGATWSVMTDWLPFFAAQNTIGQAYVHADWHTGTFAGGVFYGGTDGGIFRSADVLTAAPGAATFEDRLNRGIVSHLVYTVASGDEQSQSSAVVFGGLQDNGTRLRASAGDVSVFNQVMGGDGIGVGLGRASAGAPVGSLLIATTPGSVRRSVDSGKSFANVAGLPADLNNSSNFFMRIATEVADPKGQTFLTIANSPVAGSNPPAVTARIFRSTDGAANFGDISGTIHLTAGTTATLFPKALNTLATNPLRAGQYIASSPGGRFYVTSDGGANWFQTNPMWVDPTGKILLGGAFSGAFDPTDATGNTLWASSRAPTLTDGSAVPASVGHLFRSTNRGSTWTAMAGLPNVPVNVVKLDPGDARTVYAGTEIGLYRSTDAGATWARFGTGLPLVDVTDLSVALDGSAIRVSTFGRGFWELYPRAGTPSGVHGNGDFDHNQLVDAFDLVHEATLYLETPVNDGYSSIGNLVGDTNVIDDNDVTALVAKIGGRP